MIEFARDELQSAQFGNFDAGTRMIQNRDEISDLVEMFARLPGLGPRSSRRLVLHMLKRRKQQLEPIAKAMLEVAERVRNCDVCGNLCAADVCDLCVSGRRSDGEICVVAEVSDLWAMERSGGFKGRYHVLGGLLSMLDNIGPEEIRVPKLVERAESAMVKEVILALSPTVDGQTTAFYIAEQLRRVGVAVTSLGTGVPIGGELDYLDDGTIAAALAGRKAM